MPLVRSVADDTLGAIPGLDGLFKNLPSRTIPTGDTGLDTANADEVGLGETTFDQPDAAMAPATFDNAMSDPMADLHIPGLEQHGVTQNQDGSYSTGGAEGWRGQIVAAARKMLGTPYVWGGTSYDGVDCSGLVQLLYNAHGFNLPRISAEQARAGTRIMDFSQLKPGDLVAIDNSTRNHGADHIGIFIGNGQVIEAPRPGRNVQIASVNEFKGGWGVRLTR